MLRQIMDLISECETLKPIDMRVTTLRDQETLVLRRGFEEIHVVDRGERADTARFIIFNTRRHYALRAGDTVDEARAGALRELIPQEDWVQISKAAKERVRE